MRDKQRFWVLVGITLGLTVLVASGFASVYRSFLDAHAHEADQPGVSFSIPYAQELGLNWKQTYLALLNDVGVRHFRLMSYWDSIEKQPGQYSWNDLDYQMAQAASKNAKVSLAIGLRQPRWPECHQPEWVNQLPADQQEAKLKDFMTKVVDRYKNSPALDSYQLENEALNTVFGSCTNFDRARLVSEFNLVKSHDPNHPVIVSVSNEYGVPLGQPKGDVVGFSVYRRVYDATVTKHYVSYPFPAWYFGYKAAIIEKFLHQPVMIHELQTEPWGPKPTSQMTIAEQDKSMDAARVLATARYAHATGIKSYYLWGGEWWYWRLVKFHDPSLWNAAKQIYAQPQS